MDDLHALPKIRDSLSYLYVEHAQIERHEKSIAVWDGRGGYTPVPAASLCVLMLGPGTSITHAAIQALADNNCLVVWCGEENVRFYAFGNGGTRSAAPLLLQARLASDDTKRLEVVKRMYRMRFTEWPPDAETLTIEQLRGMEGARMRAVYAEASRQYGISWDGRAYDRSNWGASDPVNRALSSANSCLYGLCHAALLATGYSPGIGFIHTGKQLSFVYDLADLYKADISIPVAFQVAAEAAANPEIARNIERAARLRCRDRFRESKLLARIVPDLQKLFGGKDLPSSIPNNNDREGVDHPLPSDFDTADKALPGALWAPQEEGGIVRGGIAYDVSPQKNDDSPVSKTDRNASRVSGEVGSASGEAMGRQGQAARDLFYADPGCEVPLRVLKELPPLRPRHKTDAEDPA